MVQREVADRFFAAAAHEGVRRRLGARPARGRADRLPPGLARRSSGRSRTSTRRSSPSGARGLPPSVPEVKRVVEAAFAHRRKTLPNSLELAGLASAGARRRGARGDRPRAGDAGRGARAAGVRRARRGARVTTRAAPREDQPRARRRPAARRRQARGRDGAAAARPRRPGRARAGRRLAVDGFAGGHARPRRAAGARRAAGVEPRWRCTIEKRIPVAAGLGGGSSDAATALRLANETLPEPLPADALARARRRARRRRPVLPRRRAAARRGRRHRARAARAAAGLLGRARPPARRGEGVDGGRLRGLRRRDGATGTSERRAALLEALAGRRPRDLAALPPNDLASSPLADELRELGAFRADVSGAGPGRLRALRRARSGPRPPRPALAPAGGPGSRFLLGTVEPCSSPAPSSSTPSGRTGALAPRAPGSGRPLDRRRRRLSSSST